MLKQSSKKITLVINTSKTSLINVSPKKFEDAKAISKEIIKGNALLIDITNMEKIEAIRLIDFVTGSLMTIGGKFKKVAHKNYLVAPSQSVLEKFITQFVKE